MPKFTKKDTNTDNMLLIHCQKRDNHVTRKKGPVLWLINPMMVVVVDDRNGCDKRFQYGNGCDKRQQKFFVGNGHS